MRCQSRILLSCLPALAAAINPPTISGLDIVFSDNFTGSAGSSVDTSVWTIAQAIDTNNEVETYTTSNQNVQISGGETVQLVPRKGPTGVWTSGRIESVGSWTPAAGKVFVISASISMGDNPASEKQGIWPAFWALGDSIRHGTSWPECGEIDILEQVNGVETAYGTVHCGTSTGGPCDEPTGNQGSIAMPTSGFNEYAVRIDLSDDDWTVQTIEWQLNGATWRTITGNTIGDQSVWATLAHSPLYILLNVAVGGDWPGAPDSATVDGYGAMMEVAYVAVYSS
ncbi:beta-glucanase [Xylariales sp. PMI_506]|nr:beta-glucanase [Xylariales sp. PMI_506]